MLKRNQSSESLRFIVLSMVVIAILISFSARALTPKAGYSQTIPTANQKTYLPLIMSEKVTPVGPVGGTFTALVVDPKQNQVVYAGSYVSGVYKTYDQGDTWYQLNTGLSNIKIQSLAVNPNNSQIVYAGTYGGGIYISYDGGNEWMASNGNVLGNHIVYDIEIDPNNPNVIYVATRVNPSLEGYLYRSNNGGASWFLLIRGSFFSPLDYFYDIDVNPLNSSELYLTAHEHGFYKSTDAGATFSPINRGVADWSARSFALDITYPGLIYGAVWHDDGVYITWNSGSSWDNSREGLPYNSAVFRLYPDPNSASPKRIFACTYGRGLFSTSNYAQNWSSLGLSGKRLYDFVVANGSPQRWFAATESYGVYRTNAENSNWKSIMADLRLTAITGLTELPEDPVALAGAVYGQGVFRISDAGTKWTPMNEGITSLDVVSLNVAGEKLYATGKSWMDVWNGVYWQAVPLPEVSQVSPEMGINWVRERVLQPDEAFLDAGKGVQPTGAAWQNGRLLLGTAGSGLWALEDDNWQQVGLAGMTIEKMLSGFGEDVYLLTCLQGGNCGVYQFEQGEIIQNQTFGQTALPPALSSSELPFEIETIDPTKLIYAISKSEGCLWAVSEGNKVWITTDCGVGWIEHSFDWTVMSLAFDPLDSNLLLVGTRESGAFRVWIR